MKERGLVSAILQMKVIGFGLMEEQPIIYRCFGLPEIPEMSLDLNIVAISDIMDGIFSLLMVTASTNFLVYAKNDFTKMF